MGPARTHRAAHPRPHRRPGVSSRAGRLGLVELTRLRQRLPSSRSLGRGRGQRRQRQRLQRRPCPEQEPSPPLMTPSAHSNGLPKKTLHRTQTKKANSMLRKPSPKNLEASSVVQARVRAKSSTPVFMTSRLAAISVGCCGGLAPSLRSSHTRCFEFSREKRLRAWM